MIAVSGKGKGGVGVVGKLGLFWAVSVFLSSSVFKRVASSRTEVLIDGDGDSKFIFFSSFLGWA